MTAPYLFVRLFDLKNLSEPDYQIEWLLFDRDSKSVMHPPATEILAEVDFTQGDVNPAQTIVLVSGYNLSLHNVVVSNQHARHRRDAIAFAVEEQLAENADEVHIAAEEVPDSASGTDVAFQVATIRSHKMQDIITKLNLAGCDADIITSEALLLPYEPGTATLLFDGENVIFRLSEDIASTLEANVFLTFFQGYLQSKKTIDDPLKQADIPSLKRVGFWISMTSKAEQESFFAQFAQICQDHRIEISSHSLKENALSWLCQRYMSGEIKKPINLLQGSFRPQSALSWSVLHRRAVALVIIVWFVAQILVDAGTAFYLNRKANGFYDQSIAAYKSAFPQDTQIINLKAQAEQHLQGGVDSGLFKLLDFWGRHKAEANVSLDKLTYAASKGELVAEVSAAAPAAIEQVKQINDPQFAIDVNSLDSVNNIARGQIIIRENR